MYTVGWRPSLWVGFVLLSCLFVCEIKGHGRLMEPVSRASAWRRGYPNPADYNDNQGYCGGYSLQWMQYNGKCGICGDPYGASPRNHEAPGGRYANGIIVREYKIGQVIDVQVDVTANHKGNFQFKLCPNNNINQDSDQSCFDRYILKAYPQLTDYYSLPSDMPGTFKLKLKLPDGLTCSQCVLQWTYYTANSWGTCSDGKGGVGCGAQETFRACSDIKISTTGPKEPPRDIFTNDILTDTHTIELEKPQFSFFWLSGSQKDNENEIDVDSPKKRRRKKKRKRIKDRPRFHGKNKKRRRRKKKKHHRKHKNGNDRSREEIDPTLPGMEHNIPRSKLRPRKPQKPLEIPPLPQVRGDQRQPYGYFTFSLGDDEAKFGYLGIPGVNAEAINEEKLKEFETMMQGKDWP